MSHKRRTSRSTVPLLTALSVLLISCTTPPTHGEQTSTPVNAAHSAKPSGVESPFGLHIVREEFDSVVDLGATMIREIALWKDREPGRGQYRGIDKFVRQTQERGLSLVITLRPVSRWGGGDVTPRGGLSWIRYSAMPRDLPAWLQFVRMFVERYDGDGVDDMPGLTRPIKHWQVENEILWQWQDSMNKYVEFLAATSRTIRAADPEAKVVLGGLTECVALAVGAGIGDKQHITFGALNPKQYSREQVLKAPMYREFRDKVDTLLARAAAHCDIVDFHDYGDDAEDLGLVVQWLRSEMNRHGYDKPVWSLENAGPFFHFTDQAFCEDVVKRHVIGIAAGIELFCWSSLTPALDWNENFQRLSLLTLSGRQVPAYRSYRVMTDKLGGIESLVPIDAPEGIRAFQASTMSGNVIIAWSEGGPREWNLPLESGAATVTHIVTQPNVKQPRTERIPSESGALPLRIGPPIFIESSAR